MILKPLSNYDQLFGHFFCFILNDRIDFFLFNTNYPFKSIISMFSKPSIAELQSLNYVPTLYSNNKKKMTFFQVTILCPNHFVIVDEAKVIGSVCPLDSSRTKQRIGRTCGRTCRTEWTWRWTRVNSELKSSSKINKFRFQNQNSNQKSVLYFHTTMLGIISFWSVFA